MKRDPQDNDRRDPESGAPRSGWIGLLGRLAGCVQGLYALVFGWYAIILLSHCYHPRFWGKGIDDPAHLDLGEFFFGMVCALLALSGFIGGFGLLGLRRWARRWEAVYLGVLSVGVAVAAVIMSLDIHFGPAEFTGLALLSLAFAMPFVPFLRGALTPSPVSWTIRPLWKTRRTI